jgi:transcriptional regulator with XRE-family HTH domain
MMKLYPSDSAAKIGRYVKYQREKRGLSLNEFAERVGIAPSFLYRLESGSYKSVKFTVIEKLSQAFEMPVIAFLQKCELAEHSAESLPDISFYLREKLQLPTEAVEDIKLFITFIEEKYKDKIQTLKKKHADYWKTP